MVHSRTLPLCATLPVQLYTIITRLLHLFAIAAGGLLLPAFDFLLLALAIDTTSAGYEDQDEAVQQRTCSHGDFASWALRCRVSSLEAW